MKWFVAIIGLTLVLAAGLIPTAAVAQEATVPAPNFVDENGYGICDNFAERAALGARHGRLGAGGGAALRDADGDGIPNGQDSDYVRPFNGNRHGRGLGNGGVCPYGQTPAGDEAKPNSTGGRGAKAGR